MTELNTVAPKTVEVSFNFKKIAALPTGEIAATFPTGDALTDVQIAEFDRIEELGKVFHKRRSIKVALIVPAVVAALNEPMVEAAVMRLVQDFVKDTYIDQFLPVGAHDLATISAEAATRGGRTAQFSFSAETLEAAAKSLQTYLVAAIGNADAAARIAKAANNRFARTAIQRNLGSTDEALLVKLQARLDSWGLWLNENDADNAEAFAPVFECWQSSISKVLKNDTCIDIAAIL